MRIFGMVLAVLIVASCATDIQKAGKEGDRDAVRQAIKSGADVNARDEQGRTALHYAAGGGHEHTAYELIRQQHADVNVRANDGCTPLHDAAGRGHKNIVAALLVAGADPTIKDNLGRTPLDLATIGNHPKTMAELKAAMDLKAAHPSP